MKLTAVIRNSYAACGRARSCLPQIVIDITLIGVYRQSQPMLMGFAVLADMIYAFMVIKMYNGSASQYLPHRNGHITCKSTILSFDCDHSQSRTRFPTVFTADYNRYNHNSAPTELRLEFADCYRCVSNLQ